MALLFQFIGRILRWLMGGTASGMPGQPSTPQPAHPVQPPNSANPGTQPTVVPNPPGASPVVTLPAQGDLDGIDIPGFPDPTPAQPPTRQWTLMIYMAGDNGLKFETAAGWEQVMAEMTSAGYKDIVEMRTAGTSAEVACVVQFDTVSESDRSYRIIINPQGQAPTVQNIPETNTGDPVTLADFITWGQQSFPAEHYAVVIWNHGGGWKEDDLWARYRDVLPVTRSTEGRKVFGNVAVRKSLFLRTADRILNLPDSPPPLPFRSAISGVGRETVSSALPTGTSIGFSRNDMSDMPSLDDLIANSPLPADEPGSTRWIAADDSSKDFLDNSELQAAFQQAALVTGETVDIIGMDACLMAMVEVAYQLRNNATFLVASQEVEPMAGWDYTGLLNLLVSTPDLQPEYVAQAMVELYMASYASKSEAVTQSVTILPQLDALAELLNRFVVAVDLHWASNPALATTLRRAKANALRFDDRDYRDLVDFLRLVVWEMESLHTAGEEVASASAVDAVNRAAQAVLQLLGDPPRSPVLTAGVAGVNYQQPGTGAYRAHGLTIYLPDKNISQFYDGLDFRISRWGDLIRRLNGIVA